MSRGRLSEMNRVPGLGYGIPAPTAWSASTLPRTPAAWPASAASGTKIGWTAPTVIYDDMRAIKVDADKLDTLIQRFVPEGPFKASWRAWYANWNAFFEKYQSDLNKLGAILYTDDLAQRVQVYSQELANITADYNQQRQADGQVVPQTTPPPLRDPRTTSDQHEKVGSSLPWWFWVLGTLAAGGLVYYGYRRYQDAQHAKRTIQREVLPGLIGPGLARAASGQDQRVFRRSLRDVPLPMMHAKNPEQLASSVGLFYRPYEHPHLVSASSGDYSEEYESEDGYEDDEEDED